MPIQVCISSIIFKPGISCQFGYALVASISKQEHHANLGMHSRIIFKTGNTCQVGYALVTSFSKQEYHVNMVWRKLPRKVLYKLTFGMPEQGQTLCVWESQTTESALRWQTRFIVPHHYLEITLEVILEHVLGMKTMTWIFNPGSHSNSFSLTKN